LEIGLDGLVLFVELGQVGDDIFYDVRVGKRVDLGFLLGVGWNAAQTSQSVYTINIHRTASTNSLPTAPSERKSRINLVLDADQSIQHHRTSLV